MPLTYMRTFRVRYYECDTYEHVNHTNYLRYMQEAAFDASAAAGYDLARYEAIERFWLVRETDIEIMRALRYGDSVQVKTWVADVERTGAVRHYTVTRVSDGALLARGRSFLQWVDVDTEQPKPIPGALLEALAPNIADEGSI
jgi:acyl-CoA thioester hydrolase